MDGALNCHILFKCLLLLNGRASLVAGTDLKPYAFIKINALN